MFFDRLMTCANGLKDEYGYETLDDNSSLGYSLDSEMSSDLLSLLSHDIHVSTLNREIETSVRLVVTVLELRTKHFF